MPEQGRHASCRAGSHAAGGDAGRLPHARFLPGKLPQLFHNHCRRASTIESPQSGRNFWSVVRSSFGFGVLRLRGRFFLGSSVIGFPLAIFSIVNRGHFFHGDGSLQLLARPTVILVVYGDRSGRFVNVVVTGLLQVIAWRKKGWLTFALSFDLLHYPVA